MLYLDACTSPISVWFVVHNYTSYELPQGPREVNQIVFFVHDNAIEFKLNEITYFKWIYILLNISYYVYSIQPWINKYTDK